MKAKPRAKPKPKPKANAKADTHPKLEPRHQARILEWLAAGHSNTWVLDNLYRYNIPEIGHSALSYYRNLWKEELAEAVKQRHANAINAGLALRAERIQRLAEFAEEIEHKRSEEDEWGKLPKGRLYLQILEAIAAEMGDRRGQQFSEDEADVKIYVGVNYDAI